MAGFLLCLHVFFGHPYIFYDISTFMLFLWLRPARSGVRETFLRLSIIFWSFNRLIVVLSLGVYLSSFVKDLFCSPRPFAPPVTRLSKPQHAKHEQWPHRFCFSYGEPSPRIRLPFNPLYKQYFYRSLLLHPCPPTRHHVQQPNHYISIYIRLDDIPYDLLGIFSSACLVCV